MALVRASAMLASACVLACGGSPTDSNDGRIPPLGVYDASFKIQFENGFGGFSEQSIDFGFEIVSASRDTIKVNGVDGDAKPQAADLGFWNLTAYLVYIKTTFTPTIFLRVGPGGRSCEARLFYSFSRSYDGYACTIQRRAS